MALELADVTTEFHRLTSIKINLSQELRGLNEMHKLQRYIFLCEIKNKKLIIFLR